MITSASISVITYNLKVGIVVIKGRSNTSTVPYMYMLGCIVIMTCVY